MSRTPPAPIADTVEGLEEARTYLLDEIKRAFPHSGYWNALKAIDVVVSREIRRMRKQPIQQDPDRAYHPDPEQ